MWLWIIGGALLAWWWLSDKGVQVQATVKPVPRSAAATRRGAHVRDLPPWPKPPANRGGLHNIQSFWGARFADHMALIKRIVSTYAAEAIDEDERTAIAARADQLAREWQQWSRADCTAVVITPTGGTLRAACLLLFRETLDFKARVHAIFQRLAEAPDEPPTSPPVALWVDLVHHMMEELGNVRDLLERAAIPDRVAAAAAASASDAGLGAEAGTDRLARAIRQWALEHAEANEFLGALVPTLLLAPSAEWDAAKERGAQLARDFRELREAEGTLEARAQYFSAAATHLAETSGFLTSLLPTLAMAARDKNFVATLVSHERKEAVWARDHVARLPLDYASQ